MSSLSLVDFRCHPRVDVEFPAGPVVLLGSNGQGKTALVEAVNYLATQSSHRVAADAPLVRAGTDRAVVGAAVVRDGRPLTVELEINPGRANRARVNRSPVPRAREALGILRTVLFAPEDLAVVRGDPSERRRFLDDLLVQRAPRFAGVRADYERVLRQRNALLKSASAARRTGALPTLDVWDQHLAAAGSELLAARLALVQTLQPAVDKAYDAISHGGGPVVLTYRSSLPDDAGAEVSAAEGSAAGGPPLGELVDGQPPPGDQPALQAALLAGLAAVRGKELERGVSLVGPHRDDLAVELRGLPARGYASHGESWSLALALRLASYDVLRDDSAAADAPILLLDDVFAELDADRRSHLAEVAASVEQALITSAVPGDVPGLLHGATYDVSPGAVRPR